jgi:hypothetical protein
MAAPRAPGDRFRSRQTQLFGEPDPLQFTGTAFRYLRQKYDRTRHFECGQPFRRERT